MTDDVGGLSATLAADPSSLAFLDLTEALRRRGMAAEALTVVRHGLARYPALAAAHHLHARILCDLGEDAQAATAWRTALEHEPAHVEARKGLAYLDFKHGNVDSAVAALGELARALPTDQSVHQALLTVQAAARKAGRPDAVPPEADVRASELFDVTDGAGSGALLLDHDGLRLDGGLVRDDGIDASDTVAALLAGVSHDADRAARLLGLGKWQSISVEGDEGSLHLVPPTKESLLVVVREKQIPPARVAMFAERAARNARAWLEKLR